MMSHSIEQCNRWGFDKKCILAWVSGSRYALNVYMSGSIAGVKTSIMLLLTIYSKETYLIGFLISVAHLLEAYAAHQ
jgi:N6-adenosine-specific RNA methylase IME4